MKRSNTFLVTFLAFLTSAFILTNSSFAQLVGGNTYPINGVQNPPTSFRDVVAAVAYLTTNGVTGTGEVVLELSPGYPGDTTQINILPITGTSSTLGVTFRPAAGYTALTQMLGAASPNQHAINLAGCNYVTLDGRAGGVGTSRDWTVKVTGTNGQMAVRLNNTTGSMTGINIRYLNMVGEAGNTTGAVFQMTGNTTNIMSNIIVEGNYITSTADTSIRTRGYGITVASASNIGNTGVIIRNNEITDFFARGINHTGGFPGILYYGNLIYHTKPITMPTTTEFSGYYFSTTASAGAEIYNNFIYGIQLTNGSTAINGLYLFNGNTSGNSIKIYNNRIAFGSQLAATPGALPVYGLRENAVSGSLIDIYYNSVYISGDVASGTNVSAAFRKQASNFLNLKNNIFYNARTSTGGTGSNYAIMINNTTLSGIGNNDYYADGVNAVLGTTDGLTSGNQTTLAGWVSVVTADGGSVSQNPHYLAPTAAIPDLKLDPTIGSQLESGGTPIAGITTDFEGDTRNVTTPDIGADEYNGIPLDLVAPTISVTTIGNQSNTTSFSITANITDLSGIDTAANAPRLYVRKNTLGAFAFNNTPVLVGDDYTFTFNYSALGGVAIGDTIFYYVAAQDLLANAGTNPGGGLGSNPPGTTPPATFYSFFIVDVPMSGTYTVGLNLFNSTYNKNVYVEKRTRTVQRDLNGVDATEDVLGQLVTKENGGNVNTQLSPNIVEVTEEYFVLMENGQEFDQSFFRTEGTEGIYPTITAAVTDLALRGVSGPVTFSLVDALYPNETYPIVLPQAVGMDSVNTVTIKPAVGVSAEIPGSITQTSATIQVAGGDYYVIDGSNTVGGTTKDLKIVGLAVGTFPSIHLFSAANNNIFKNLIVESQNSSSTSGTFLYGSGDPSNNNLVDNCLIKNIDTVAVRHRVAIYHFSSIAYSNDVVQNSELKDFDARGVYLRGAPATNLQVLNNKIYQTGPTTQTALYGIQVDRCDGTIISGNMIYDLSTTSTSTSAVVGGLYFFGSSTSGDVTFVNNVVSIGANLATTTALQRGIDYWAYSVNSFQAFYNTFFIGGAGVTDALISAAVIKRDAANIFRLYDNSLYNERSNGTGTAKHYAIAFSNTTATTFDLNYNDYYVNGTGGVLGLYGTTDVTTIADWRTSTSQDSNSISADPLFVSDTDLRPGVASPLLLAGTSIAGITTDILGATRNATTPTIGAYEVPFGTIGWANLQWPPSGTIITGSTLTAYAQIWVDGLTNQPGPGNGIQSWIGVNNADTDPSTWTTWVPVVFNVDAGNNDEYMAAIGSNLAPGTYYYASRFSLYGGDYYYGGYNAGGGGQWNGTTNVSGVLTVDPAYTSLWQRAAVDTTLPAWFSPTGSTERGLAFGRTSDGLTEAVNNRVFVVSRNGGTFVKVLNAANGTDIGDLNTTGITGGTFALNDIGVTEDGKILACNMVAPGDFKVYMWDNEASAPVVALTYTSANRLGDKFTVVGSYVAGTAEIWAASATTGQHLVYKWTMSSGTFNPVPQVITCSDALTTGISSAAVGPLPNGDFYWNANGQNARKYQANGTLIGIIPGTLVATGSNAIRYLGVVDSSEYVATFTYGTGNQNARILSIPNGNPTNAVLYAVTPPLGANSNANGTGDVDFQVDTNLTVNVFVLATNNGLGAYKSTTIIPVELSTFAANVVDGEVVVTWSTASELNNSGFELERLLDADWQKVAFIQGKGTTTEQSDYSYVDKFRFESYQGAVQYRLKQIDFDGTVSYSRVISVDVDFTPREFALFQNYPNPFNPATTIKFALPFNSNVKISVFNILGEQVAVLLDQVKEVGYHNVSWNANQLASGVYFYNIEAKSVDGAKTFNAVKKMMLIK